MKCEPLVNPYITCAANLDQDFFFAVSGYYHSQSDLTLNQDFYHINGRNRIHKKSNLKSSNLIRILIYYEA